MLAGRSLGANRFAFRYSNWDTPSNTPGLSLTPGASNAEGTVSATPLATGTNLSKDIYGLWLSISGGNSTGQQKDHLIDIGVDPTDGTSYTYVISNIIAGSTDAGNRGAKEFYFPIFIKAGSRVSVRAQGNNGTAGTIRVCASFYGQPTRPELVWTGTYSETIGTITNSGGVSFTPGNAGEGSWASLGTTTRALKWLQLCAQLSNGTSTAQFTHVDLAFGDGSNKHIVIANHYMSIFGTAEIDGAPFGQQVLEGGCEVPAGATLYVRGHCSTAPASGYNAVAVGIG